MGYIRLDLYYPPSYGCGTGASCTRSAFTLGASRSSCLPSDCWCCNSSAVCSSGIDSFWFCEYLTCEEEAENLRVSPDTIIRTYKNRMGVMNLGSLETRRKRYSRHRRHAADRILKYRCYKDRKLNGSSPREYRFSVCGKTPIW